MMHPHSNQTKCGCITNQRAQLVLPDPAKQVLDQSSDVADVHSAVEAAVGLLVIFGISQQHVDQGGNVTDVHLTVTVHVTTLKFGTVGKQGHALEIAPCAFGAVVVMSVIPVISREVVSPSSTISRRVYSSSSPA